MITNLLLATLLTFISFLLLITLDQSSAIIHRILRRVLILTRRSKRLTSYLLKAYLSYRRSMQAH